MCAHLLHVAPCSYVFWPRATVAEATQAVYFSPRAWVIRRVSMAWRCTCVSTICVDSWPLLHLLKRERSYLHHLTLAFAPVHRGLYLLLLALLVDLSQRLGVWPRIHSVFSTELDVYLASWSPTGACFSVALELTYFWYGARMGGGWGRM